MNIAIKLLTILLFYIKYKKLFYSLENTICKVNNKGTCVYSTTNFLNIEENSNKIHQH